VKPGRGVAGEEAKALIPAEACITVVTESQIPPSQNASASAKATVDAVGGQVPRQPKSAKSSVASNLESACSRFIGVRGWTLDVLNIVLGSATVSVAVCNVPLRTSSTPSVRRDADRRVRDARAPHFTRELEKLHPDT